ncbi:MAG: nucleoside triphosphate hydrolase [Pseudomonadota bacterium]|jgi:MazG family protein
MTKGTSHTKSAEALATFLDVIAQLRNPTGGCPWDLKQTFESLRSCLIEESYEVADAVEAGEEAVREELGDLMSIIALYARIAEERGSFSFASVVEGITDKLIRRHPHVFGDLKVSGEEEVLKNWEAIKEKERAAQPAKPKGLLDGLPRSMPALQKCHEIGVRCARVGFDWTTTQGVAEKVREELGEFLAELPDPANPSSNVAGKPFNKALVFEEFGDLLFTLAQESRHLGFNAEEALVAANAKFMTRFKHLEQIATEENPEKPLATHTTDELEALWQQAKKRAAKVP